MACSPFIAIVSAAEIINLLCGHWVLTVIGKMQHNGQANKEV
jgi:hypothetical protein